jgi:tetratricopeptide (TPR) repeat protein
MAKVSLATLKPTIELLLERQQYSEAVIRLEKVHHTLSGWEEWQEFLEFFEAMPPAYLLESVEAAELFAKALKWLGRNEALLEWAARVVEHHGVIKASAVQSEWASGLIILQKYDQARLLLNAAIPHLSGEALGTAWSRMGYSLYNLGEPVALWREAYASARLFLSGEELGRALLNEGYCLANSGLEAECRGVWHEALAYFRTNPYFQAWTRLQLGISCLRRLEPDAERHFLEATHLTRNPKAAELRAAVLNGLGAYRRVKGEWSRAVAAYQQALRTKPNGHDRTQAIVGIARTQRLAGRTTEALGTIEPALRDESLKLPLLYLARALAYLALAQPADAQTALTQAGEIKAESDHWLWRIARAELCRQQGQPEEAVTLLEGLPLHTLHAREEVPQWPGLFDLLRRAGKEVPLPLDYQEQLVVEVQALGVLQVRINGRSVYLASVSRTAELLVLLLESGLQASSEQLVAALWPGQGLSEKRKALWQLAADLRGVLGWNDSVRLLDGAYALDPEARWVYDVDQARARKRVRGAFFEGVYSNWALEVDRELEVYRT